MALDEPLTKEGPGPVAPVPFLRWAGSKRSLSDQFVDLVPRRFGRYWEPFLGSGALFFRLRPRMATLSDACTELIDVFKAVQTDPEGVYWAAIGRKVDAATFYDVRSARSKDPIRRAGEFIYLNKTCWNGLYRVNSRGEFNVPFGKPKTPNVADLANLVACSSVLNGDVVLRSGDFQSHLTEVEAGDLVFFDPPYITTHANNGFVDYNEQLFSWDDQVRLAQVAEALAEGGATVIVTNAHHDDVAALYPRFERRIIERSSTLANDVTKRRRVSEMVLYRLANHG